jgi:hypothetical protein
MENGTPIRYLTFSWNNQLPVRNVTDNQSSLVREANSAENARIRPNQGT